MADHYNVMIFVEGAMTLRCRFFSAVLFLCLCGMAVYAGRVEMGEDLMVIDVGVEVRVTPPAAEAGPR